MKKFPVICALALAAVFPLQAQAAPELLVTVTSDDLQTQGLALILASQAIEQKAKVRVLLCSKGGELALKDKESAQLKPRNVSPKQMLQGLIKNGAQVDVCAIFLPNSDWKPADLIEGVGVAKPQEVTTYLLQPDVRLLSY